MDETNRLRPEQTWSATVSINIEKVSKFVSNSTPSRSGEGEFSRQILVSIPRVRWLESDLESCKYYSQYQANEPKTFREEAKIREKSVWARSLSGKALSPQEVKIKRMLETMDIDKIASSLKLAKSTIKSCVASIKAKESTPEE